MDGLETLNLLRVQRQNAALESRRAYSANPDGKSMKLGLMRLWNVLFADVQQSLLEACWKISACYIPEQAGCIVPHDASFAQLLCTGLLCVPAS